MLYSCKLSTTLLLEYPLIIRFILPVLFQILLSCFIQVGAALWVTLFFIHRTALNMIQQKVL